ncbi:MAG: RidA family protein [Tabrizicola flagellatus]|uniref:RidA family protein n=1 Tax=Tabrizicola flagellatus TaxID=2593021 RepID=UPI00391D3D3A
MQAVNPPALRPPFARYSHAVLTGPVSRLLAISGQLGVAPDDSVPEGAAAQAALCLANIDRILAAAAMTRTNVLRLNAYVTDRAHMAGYMAARDAWAAELSLLPASTLMIVTGFTRPEFVVEIEALAAEA